MAEAAKLGKEEIVEAISQMSVLELSNMVKELEEKFGVSAAAPVAMVAQAGGGQDAAPVAEKTKFDAVLISFGEKKIQVIKEVRAITSLGLKEAKELVEGVPKPIKEGIPKEQAEEIKKKIEDAGGAVEVK